MTYLYMCHLCVARICQNLFLMYPLFHIPVMLSRKQMILR
nr:MAG TPA: hypothetical protein [Caudoviricetes sp.]